MKIKVIQVIDNVDAGGAQEIVYSVCKYSQAAASNVVALSGKGAYYEKILPYAGKFDILSKFKWDLPLIIGRLLVIIKNKNCVINGHLQGSSLLLSLLRLFFKFPLILTIHAIPSQLPWWYNKIYPLLCGLADYYIVEDKIAYQFLIDGKINPEKIKFISIGTEKVMAVKAPEIDIKKEFNISSRDVILLNIARMDVPKGQRDLLFALKKINNRNLDKKFHLIIIGYGPEENNLRQLARKLQVEQAVTFTGKRTDLHNFYAKADWFIMPCYDESMGVVIYDSLAYRLPIIAYNSGSIAEVIDAEDKGYLVNKDFNELVKILTDQYPPRKLQLTDKQLYQYSAQKMAEDYDNCYKLLAKKAGITN